MRLERRPRAFVTTLGPVRVVADGELGEQPNERPVGSGLEGVTQRGHRDLVAAPLKDPGVGHDITEHFLEPLVFSFKASLHGTLGRLALIGLGCRSLERLLGGGVARQRAFDPVGVALGQEGEHDRALIARLGRPSA